MLAFFNPESIDLCDNGQFFAIGPRLEVLLVGVPLGDRPAVFGDLGFELDLHFVILVELVDGVFGLALDKPFDQGTILLPNPVLLFYADSDVQ